MRSQQNYISAFPGNAGFMSPHKDGEKEDLSEYILASLSHDIKSPLNFMDCAVGKLKQALLGNDTNLAFLIANGIGQSLSAICGRLEELTSFYQTYLTENAIAATQFDVGSLITGIVNGLSGVFSQNRNRIVVTVPEAVCLFSNPSLVSIVVHNILDNASKHCVGCDIEISAEETEHATRIVVKDHGDGMPAAIADWLCGARELTQEIGVGLVLVKKLSGCLGAKIELSVCKGTLLSLTFPHSAEIPS
ncbi:HAMP domain-containing histidine kinase [Dyadobacter sp. CY261]|uniref:sensor histidine kinase n=1 Tax=Dyadobacter sp. CY261 TaxID=2907203 RepID=UPI001F2A9ACD|nr:HAMP domain-containing sensor histidine kinase [Dyadobacter sp. CY261]MCF0072755.1 HAMP domain-containing histidine kinase [Dyadobacter sp. CY261]